MRGQIRWFWVLAVAGGATCAMVGCPTVGVNPPVVVPQTPELTAPDGFSINEFVSGLKAPRFMAMGPGGVVLAAERDAGRIIALPDYDSNGVADAVLEIVPGLDAPTSMAYRDGQLYIAETTRVLRVDLDDSLVASNPTVIVDGLPADGHSSRTVIFGADGKLYLSMGSSCNVCIESDPRRAAVSVYDADGSNGRVYMSGLRNAVGLAVEPLTGLIWASDNGRDLLGDDVPPETVYVLRDGGDAGWPRCHAGSIVDPDFGASGACDGVDQPVVTMQAHMAPLGIAFYTGTTFPPQYTGNLFVALHGSWNRTVPVGYKVMRVPVVGGMVAGQAQDFVTGWMRADGTVSGRPVGVLMTPKGDLLISDDAEGRIQRVSFVGP